MRAFALLLISMFVIVLARDGICAKPSGNGKPAPNPWYTADFDSNLDDAVRVTDGLGSFMLEGIYEGASAYLDTGERFLDFDFSRCVDPLGCIVPDANQISHVVITNDLLPPANYVGQTWVTLTFDADGYRWQVMLFKEQDSPPQIVQIDVDGDGAIDYFEVESFGDTVAYVRRKPSRSKAYEHVGYLALPFRYSAERVQ